MGWFGTLIGSSLGFVFGGPLGAIGGAALGHILIDRHSAGFARARGQAGYNVHETRQAGYFVALFSLMGKIASADDHISESERDVVRQFIAKSHMHPTQREYALRIFEEASRSPHSVKELVEQFYALTAGQSQYHLNFMDFLARLAAADGVIDRNEERLLSEIAVGLYISDNDFRIILQRATQGGQQRDQGSRSSSAQYGGGGALADAYRTLGCTPQSSDSEVRSAYRALAAAYHPDKIIAKDLPEEFTELAKNKFQDIQSAYETIKKARNFK